MIYTMTFTISKELSMAVHIQLDIPHEKDDVFQTAYGLHRMRLEAEREKNNDLNQYSFSLIETCRLLTSVFFFPDPISVQSQ